MSAANKKQRREAKRKAKRREIRRRESISPIKRLADAPGEVEIWISEDLESDGQMQIFGYKRAAGLTGMVAFLVDRGVVGLKDTWIRVPLDHADFDEAIEASRRRGISMRRGTVDEARYWVAGGLRWARENGMRLPGEWAKAAAFLGGVVDWQSADVSGFVKEFVGHPEDLRQRLIAEPLESYLKRDDIEFIFSTDAPYMDHETGNYVNNDPVLADLSDEALQQIADEIPDEQIDQLMEKLKPIAEDLAGRSESWLQRQGKAPSDELVEGWKSVFLASLLGRAACPDGDEVEAEELGMDFLEGISGRLEERRVAEHNRAVKQILWHLEADPQMMQEAIAKHRPEAEI